MSPFLAKGRAGSPSTQLRAAQFPGQSHNSPHALALELGEHCCGTNLPPRERASTDSDICNTIAGIISYKAAAHFYFNVG